MRRAGTIVAGLSVAAALQGGVAHAAPGLTVPPRALAPSWGGDRVGPAQAVAHSGSGVLYGTGARSAVYAQDLATGRTRTVLSQPAGSPRVSPDGRSVGVEEPVAGGTALRVYGVDGVRLPDCALGTGTVGTAWRADSRAYAVLDPARREVRVCDLRTRAVRSVPVTTAAVPSSWSPDGTGLLFSDGTLGLLDLTTGGVRRLRTDAGAPLAGWLPTWSPDGTTIAFTAYDGDDARGRPRGHLVTVEADGFGRHDLPATVVRGGASYAPVWSLDSSALLHDRRGADGSGGSYRTDVDGRSARLVAGGLLVGSVAPAPTARPTSLSLDTGAAPLLRGRLGAAGAGRRVLLQSRWRGARSWTASGSARTRPDGTFALRLTRHGARQVRFVYGGSVLWQRAVSPARSVALR